MAERCRKLPSPEEMIEYLPGLRLTSATNSGQVLAGKALLTVRKTPLMRSSTALTEPAGVLTVKQVEKVREVEGDRYKFAQDLDSILRDQNVYECLGGKGCGGYAGRFVVPA
mgnify:CR=1 FL=1